MSFFETDDPLTHRVDDYRLTPRDPASCIRRRQVGDSLDLRQEPVLCRVPGRYALGHSDSIVSHVEEERDRFFQMFNRPLGPLRTRRGTTAPYNRRQYASSQRFLLAVPWTTLRIAGRALPCTARGTGRTKRHFDRTQGPICSAGFYLSFRRR
jgi:hypothetical protein